MNVLVVSALSDLKSVNSEIEGIVNSGLKVQLLRDATVSRLADYAHAKDVDVIWFATHGVDADQAHGISESGVLLADGVLGASSIGQIAKANNITKIVMNTCDSIAVALSIADHTQADIICTVGQVGDNTAALTGRTLAEMLAKYSDFRLAYEKSKPSGNKNYIYLSSYRKDDMQNSDLFDRLDKWGKSLEVQIQAVGERLSCVELDLANREIAIQRKIDERIGALEKKIDIKYHPQLTKLQGQKWLVGYILFIVGVLVTPSIWRYRLDTYEGWFIGAICFVSAASFFLNGLNFQWREPRVT